MKKLLMVFCAIAMIVIITTCGQKFSPISQKNTAIESADSKSAKLNEESIINLSDVNEIKELEGKVFNKKTEVIDIKDFIQMIEQPKGYTKIYIGNACGAMVTKTNKLLVFSLYDVYYPTSKELADYIDQGRYKIEYYELPGILSSDIFIDDSTNRVDGLWEDTLESVTAGDEVSNSIIIDRKNALLLSFTVSEEKLLINKVIKLKEDISAKYVKSVFSYKKKGDNIILLSDVNNNIYKMDSLTLKNDNQDEKVNLKASKEWKIVGGIHSPLNMNGEIQNTEQYFIYLYNLKNNRFAKHNVINKEDEYEIDLSTTPLHGEIIKVVSDGVGIYILAMENGKYTLFYVNENNENWKNSIKITRYEDGSELGKVDDIWWFKVNDALDYIAVFDKNAKGYPVKLTSLSQGQRFGTEE